MANSINNVVVGKPLVTGGVLLAPTSSTLPVDAMTALDAAFVAVGYITDNGVVKSEKRNSGTIAAWGGDTVASTSKEYAVSFKLDLAEFLNAVAQSIIYGTANVTTTAATLTTGNALKVTATSQATPHKAWVFEILNDIKKVRLVVPNAKVMEIGDTTFKDDAIAANALTLQAFPDSTGAYYYVYTDDGQKTA